MCNIIKHCLITLIFILELKENDLAIELEMAVVHIFLAFSKSCLLFYFPLNSRKII